MLIPDMPNVPPQNVPVMIAQANQVPLSQDKIKSVERVLGVCEIIDNEERKGVDGGIYPNSDFLSPVRAVMMYFQEYEHRNDFTSVDYDAAKVTILTQPKYGTLVEDSTLKGRYIFSPNAGYVGKDSVELLAEVKGMKVKVHYFIHVTEYNEPNAYEDYCEHRGGQWKISLASGSIQSIVQVEQTGLTLRSSGTPPLRGSAP